MRNILKLYSGTQSETPVSPKKIVDFEKLRKNLRKKLRGKNLQKNHFFTKMIFLINFEKKLVIYLKIGRFSKICYIRNRTIPNRS